MTFLSGWRTDTHEKFFGLAILGKECEYRCEFYVWGCLKFIDMH